MSLRILLIGPYPYQPGKINGGVEAVTSTLAHALTTLEDIDLVGVLSFHRGLSSPYCVAVAPKLSVWHLLGQKRLALPTRSWLDVRQARRVAAEFKPDIVHGQGISSQGYIATTLSSNPVVTAHGLVHAEAKLASRGTPADRVRVRLVGQLARSVLRCAKVVISTSAYDAQALDRWVFGRRVSIANPVPAEFFQATDAGTTMPQILFAGTLVRRKNVEGLLRAFKKVRAAMAEARLVIVGPSPDPGYLSEIRDLVETMHLTDGVTFKGHVETAELINQLQQCRLVALFSHEETSPTILAQAMASGKPIVASTVGGIPELVADGENGYLVPDRDETALADRLLKLVQSPSLGQKMGAVGREMAHQRCEPHVVARQTVLAYRLAIEEAR